MHACVCVCMYVCVHVCVLACVCTYVCMRVSMYMYMCLCMYVHRVRVYTNLAKVARRVVKVINGTFFARPERQAARFDNSSKNVRTFLVDDAALPKS